MEIMAEKKKGSYAEILNVAIPLILCTSSMTIQLFVDRLFLSHYSSLAFAAVVPAGLTMFAITCFFIGVSDYVSTFVAQYTGAGENKMVGPSLWQGVYFALFSGFILTIVYQFIGDWLFSIIKHEEALPEMEAAYFKVLAWGTMPGLLFTVFSCFYSGRGKTYPLVVVNVISTAVNCGVNYLLIFGKFGFPELGLKGAAVGTVLSHFSGAIILGFMVFSKKHRIMYNLLDNCKINYELFSRLMKFGIPCGTQFMVDIVGFTIFVNLVGKLGKIELAATNLAFNVNMLAFMPMIGFAIATQVLVGQYIGQGDPKTAVKIVKRCFRMTFIYMGLIAATYVLIPEVFVNMFGSEKDLAEFEKIKHLASILLRFVALYSIFDTINLIYSSALRGAGDTFFIMIALSISSIGLLILPPYICCVIYKTSVYLPWSFLTLYIGLVAVIFYLRYRHGKWKKMKVI